MSEKTSDLEKDISKIIEEFREKTKNDLQNAGIKEQDINDPSLINFLGIEKYFNEKPIKIAEIIDCLDSVSEELIIVYNTETGEFVSFWLEEMNRFEENGIEKIISECPEWEKETYMKLDDYFTTPNDNKYIHLPNKYEINDVQIMQEFIYELNDKNVAEQLHNCMNQKGMYRKFKDKLYELGIEKQYYKYREGYLREIAINWCNENCLKYEE